MNAYRSSSEVIEELLATMARTVTAYHPTVSRTATNIPGLIGGTACFPGGAGLWRGHTNGGELPDSFPTQPVMFVGHNFDSQRAYEISLANRGEVYGQFWQRLIVMVEGAGLTLEECFFTNALMGLKPGSATGAMPSVPDYREQCMAYLREQVRIVQPRAIIALGVKADPYVQRLGVASFAVRHPSDWHFREVATRKERLQSEGYGIREFLRSTAPS